MRAELWKLGTREAQTALQSASLAIPRPAPLMFSEKPLQAIPQIIVAEVVTAPDVTVASVVVVVVINRSTIEVVCRCFYSR